MKVIAVFSSQGGTGKTTLVYHLAWMLAELGHRVVAADLDPQVNLTAMVLDEERLEQLWSDDGQIVTAHGAMKPLLSGTGDMRTASLRTLGDGLALLPGDVALASAEDELATAWVECLRGSRQARQLTSGPHELLRRSAAEHEADFALVDLGPGLGALNRAVLLGSDQIVVPVVADLFSVLSLRILGSTLRQWRDDWALRRQHAREGDEDLDGELSVLGYVTMLHTLGSSRSKASVHWTRTLPAAYREFVLGLSGPAPASVEDDPQCLAVLRHYLSLMSMAQQARKPIFRLTPADGAIGAHGPAVRDAHRDFARLARTLVERSTAG